MFIDTGMFSMPVARLQNPFRISSRQRVRGSVFLTQTTSGRVPAAALRLPSGFSPAKYENLTNNPESGRRIRTGVAPSPSPDVLLPTSVAYPVALQKQANFSDAE